MASEILDITITVHRTLPVEPDIREWMQRVTRWQMADILIQLGEDPGPKPDDKLHVFKTNIGGKNRIFVSQEMFDRIIKDPHLGASVF